MNPDDPIRPAKPDLPPDPDDAIPRLVALEGGRLYSLGLRFCGSREDAEDLVQETFLQAYRNWRAFEGRAPVTSWLYSIAARVCQRLHRKRSGEPDHIESLEELLPLGDAMCAVADDTDGPLATEIRAEGKRRIEAAIAALPLDFRMPLVLKEIVGLGLAEIAAITGIKEATLKTRLHRARLKVRASLDDVLPQRELPPVRYDRQVCLDLLEAKQESLDRGVAFEFPDRVICDRCSAFFETLDLSSDVCRELSRGELPAPLRDELLARLRAEPPAPA